MTLKGFRFRETMVSDFSELEEVINRAYDVEKFFKTCERIDQQEIKANSEKGIFLIAEDDQRLAACIYYKLNGEKAYFGLLSVHPDYQGRGLARELISRVETIARKGNARYMEIEVVNLRTELPPFYEKLGYKTHGTVPFKDIARSKLPCHFVIMRKEFCER